MRYNLNNLTGKTEPVGVSGLTYEVNPTIPSPCVQDGQNQLDHIDGNMARRIGNVLVNGVPLDPEKTYKVCMTSYIFFDVNSFVEIGTLVESRCDDFGMAEKKVAGDGVIIGYGTINGRK